MAIDSLGIASALASQARPPATEPSRRLEAAQAFEGYMVELMVQEMRKTIPEGLFHSAGVEMFSGMFDQAIAKEIGAAGGLGLARLMGGSECGEGQAPLQISSEPGCAAGACPRAPFAGCSQPVEGTITSDFGYRNDPFDGGQRFHRGLDIAAPVGTPIRSLADGVVTLAEDREGYGRVVVVQHADGWSSLFAHCEDLGVAAGEKVVAGDILGTVGSTGRSTGPHLHLEIHAHGRAVDPSRSLAW